MIQQTTTPTERITCPIWHSPLLFVVPGGLLIKCKSCRKEMHHVSREELERFWDKLAIGQITNAEIQGQEIA